MGLHWKLLYNLSRRDEEFIHLIVDHLAYAIDELAN